MLYGGVLLRPSPPKVALVIASINPWSLLGAKNKLLIRAGATAPDDLCGPVLHFTIGRAHRPGELVAAV